MSDIVEWMDPPKIEHLTAKSRIEQVVEELKRNPGRWARVRRNAGPSYTKPYRERGCETAARRVKDPKDPKKAYDIYARWSAPKAEAAAQQKAPAPSMAEKATQVTQRGHTVATPKVTPGAPAPGNGRVVPDPRTKPRKMTNESEGAYQFRLQRWQRGVPTEGKAL